MAEAEVMNGCSPYVWVRGQFIYNLLERSYIYKRKLLFMKLPDHFVKYLLSNTVD
jgi:hypothetical protein